MMSDDPIPVYIGLPDSTEYIYIYSGGLGSSLGRYVIYKNTEFILIKNEDDFRSIFAPISSPLEALSYLLAVTNFEARFGLEWVPEFVYFVEKIEDTHIVSSNGNYIINLFGKEIYGCGPHRTFQGIFQITANGRVIELSREPIFKNPAEDNDCVD
ncbi:MAG: hypothetical protein HQ510_01260 [Candidatus Marinimicrobia bacterium]|nr:hypothetical protein [Candidatus Neomarinimicrobiota bacterium]